MANSFACLSFSGGGTSNKSAYSLISSVSMPAKGSLLSGSGSGSGVGSGVGSGSGSGYGYGYVYVYGYELE